MLFVPQDESCLRYLKFLFFTHNCISILHLLDREKLRSLKHYYHKQIVRKTVSVVDHNLLHNESLMWVYFFDSLLFILESWHSVTHVTIVDFSEMSI